MGLRDEHAQMRSSQTENRIRSQGPAGDLLIDVCYGVHPAADAHLVPHVGRVAELVDDADVVGVGTAEQLLLQRQRVHLQNTAQRALDQKTENLRNPPLRAWTMSPGPYILNPLANLKIKCPIRP